MHLAQFVHRYPPARGGAEAYAHRLAEYLRTNGDTVEIWTTTAIQLEEFWTSRTSPQREQVRNAPPLLSLRACEGICRYRPLTFPLRRYLLKAMTFLPSAKLRSFVLPCNPICPAMWRDAGRYDGPLDAVHAMAFPYAWPILCARRLARRRGVPFLLTPFLHLSDERTKRQYTQPALRWLLLDADRVFVQTKLERDEVLELGAKSERVVLQGLGVDPSECTGGWRQAFRHRHGIEENEVVIGHLANLSVEKGTVDLLEAAKQLNCRVMLAGSSMANFRNYYRNYDFKARVIILGEIDEETKRDFYSAIDIFALPSRSDSFGLVILEAWANGKPCVAYRAAGPGEIIRDGADGLLACDQPELAGQLRKLIWHPELRSRLGQSGERRLGREFDWETKLAIVRETLLGYSQRRHCGPEKREWMGIEPTEGVVHAPRWF